MDRTTHTADLDLKLLINLAMGYSQWRDYKRYLNKQKANFVAVI